MEKQSSSRVMLTRKEAEEYCTYKRQKKISEIMSAFRRSESELTAYDSAVRLGEQALRLRQAAVRMTPVDLLARGEEVCKNGMVDCIVGGNGETLISVKVYETKKAVKLGVKEITLRLTPSFIDNGRYTELRKEMKSVKRVAKKTIVKARVEMVYPQATLERLIRIASEVGLAYFSLPYFSGCERLQTVCKGGCLLEVSGIDNLFVFKEMAGAGIGRMLVKGAWDMYNEWLKEVENITVEQEEVLPLSSKDEEKGTPLLLPPTKDATPQDEGEKTL